MDVRLNTTPLVSLDSLVFIHIIVTMMMISTTVINIHVTMFTLVKEKVALITIAQF